MLAFETRAKVFNALVVSCIFELPTLRMMKIVLQVIELVPMHLLVKVKHVWVWQSANMHQLECVDFIVRKMNMCSTFS
jgi:hypothetical protein